MDIQVNRFRDVLGLMKPVIPRKTNLPVLTHFLLKDGRAVATDLDTMVMVPVPEVDIECLLPYADVVDTLQYVQGYESLHIEPEDGKVTLSWADGNSSFATIAAKEYPEVPEFVPVAEALLDIDTLIPVMTEVLSFAATKTTRPVLNGVTLLMGEKIAVAAGDGFRMAYKTLPLSFPQEKTCIVPSGSVTALKLLWAKTPRTPPASDSLIPVITAKKHASVALDKDRGLRFVFGDKTTAIVKLVQGSPPEFVKLLPKEKPAIQATVMAQDLELAVRRVARVAAAGAGMVRMVFGEDSAIISTKHADQEVESTIKVLALQGTPDKVAIDARLLLNYLKGRDGLITLSWVKTGSPVAFKHQTSPSVLIMPMSVKWDGDEPTPEAEQAKEDEAVAEGDEQAEAEAVAESTDQAEAEAETTPEEEPPPAPPEEPAKSPKRRGKKGKG